MTDTLSPLLARALGSDLFAGGALLALFGLAMAMLRGTLGSVLELAARRLSVSVTLDSRSAAFRHLWLWIDETGALAHVRRLRTTGVHGARGELFGPGEGRHWLRAGRHLGTVTRSIGRPTAGRAVAPETVELRLFLGSLATIRGWIEEGARIAERADRAAPRLHMLSGTYWDEIGPVPVRDLSTVLADDDRIERLAADLRRFTEARDWYAARGVPWRRGYLLHGPPGTGKSSVIRALAHEIGLGVAILDLSRPSLGDDDLREALYGAPPRTIVAMEDIDAAFTARGPGRGVSFSGLLNAIDGIGAQEGRALVMTTNHPERLDPALTRPGRADVHVELGHVGAQAAARLYRRFFPGDEARAARFADAIGEARHSAAELQGWLLRHADDPEAASAAPA